MTGRWTWQALQGQGGNPSLPFSFTSEGYTAPLVPQSTFKATSFVSRVLAYAEGREYYAQIQLGRIPLGFTHAERQADGRYALWTFTVLASDVDASTQWQVASMVRTFARLS